MLHMKVLRRKVKTQFSLRISKESKSTSFLRLIHELGNQEKAQFLKISDQQTFIKKTQTRYHS